MPAVPETNTRQILQVIAEYLDTDRNIINLGLACKTTHRAITSSVWRKRFLIAFDPLGVFDPADPFDSETVSPEHYVKVYKTRRAIANSFTTFASPRESREKQLAALNMVKDLVLGT